MVPTPLDGASVFFQVAAALRVIPVAYTGCYLSGTLRHVVGHTDGLDSRDRDSHRFSRQAPNHWIMLLRTTNGVSLVILPAYGLVEFAEMRDLSIMMHEHSINGQLGPTFPTWPTYLRARGWCLPGGSPTVDHQRPGWQRPVLSYRFARGSCNDRLSGQRLVWKLIHRLSVTAQECRYGPSRKLSQCRRA